jgi:hypothetical protein
MAGLFRQKSRLERVATEKKIPDTCQIVRTIKTSDGKIFGMDRIEDAIEHEALFLQTLNIQKCAKEFADSADYVIRDIEVEINQPRQRLINLYVLTKQHCISQTSGSRKAMLQALYYFLIENGEAAEKIARKYKRINRKYKPISKKR